MFGLKLPQALRLDQIEGRFDPVLIGSALALAALGVVMVASSSIAIAEGLDVGPYHFLVRHLVFLGIGMVGAAVLCRVELRQIERYSRFALLLCFILLLLVFVPGIGRKVNGAQRWLNFGISGFQAVEAVKPLLIVWLASYLVRYREQVQGTAWGVLKPLGLAGLMVVLLLLQPDFGSALLLCALTAAMVWVGGVRIRYLIAPALLAVPLMVWAAFSESYRIRRLTSFLNPWEDPFNDGFQLTQALIAIGRGEWFGVGLGASVQKLFYLPEAHTDFIFAVIAEELGFAGIVLVVGLYVLLVSRAFWLGLKAVDMGRAFAGYCAFGIAVMISIQALVSVGVNLGVLPTKGLTLPLISSGGSSVLMTCVAVGLLLRVSHEVDRAERQAARLRQVDAVPAEELLGLKLSPAPASAAGALSPDRPQPQHPGVGATPAAIPGARPLRVEPRLGALT